jgi:hypothetical protein
MNAGDEDIFNATTFESLTYKPERLVIEAGK